MIRRSYEDRDLPPLRSAVEGWIAEAGRCGYDHSGELAHRIYENLRGRRPVGELVHVWSDGPDVVGLSICLRFGATFDVLVAPRWRGTPVERELLDDAYRTTVAHVAPGERYVNSDVFSCDHRRVAALEALGFERYRLWDHVRERPLDGAVAFEGAVEFDRVVESDGPVEFGGAVGESTVDGFGLRTATLADADQLAAARNAAFDEDWTGDEYRREVMLKPGYDPDREIVAVAPDGRVVAYAVFWIDGRNRLGHLEPVGTHREFRRRGLAAAVVRRALATMAAAGVTSVSVNHDAGNEPAGRLYASLGFAVRHETYGYRRAITRD